MLVSWEWLNEYVELELEHSELADRFAMSGLNHEGTEIVGDDPVLDLEVTSNRGDCLGHLGVAREAAVLTQIPLRIPDANPTEIQSSASEFVGVENLAQDICPQYTARIIRGVKVGPSPDWLRRRLAAIGINSVNNVVDVTNYVMMECGQPLHAFDLDQINGQKIVVRRAKDEECFVAIDHREYQLDSEVLVIADQESPIAIAGVMGGAESEVSDSTQNLVIESAAFASMSVRKTARKLKLHSPSSFRFERKPDQHGLDWASRRCCELILQVAGGELCSGVEVAGESPQHRDSIEFCLTEIQRVLGIEVPSEQVLQILTDLGCEVRPSGSNVLTVVPPTWREDVSRPADLIEEVARIYGYDQIPEDVAVPINVSSQRPKDVSLGRLRLVLSAHGIDEAMTPSVTSKNVELMGSMWTNLPALEIDTPILEGSTQLRRGIVPSLLQARRANETQSISNACLYEVATIYLPAESQSGLPNEQSTLGVVTGHDLRGMRGIAEELVRQIVPPNALVTFSNCDNSLLQAGTGQNVYVNETLVGCFGTVSQTVRKTLKLDQACTAAEFSVDALTEQLQEVRTAISVSLFPTIQRDLNFILDESTSWASLEDVCRSSANSLLQAVEYRETYRDANRDGAGRKRVLLSLIFQSHERTLTGEEVDNEVQAIIAACQKNLAAELVG